MVILWSSDSQVEESKSHEWTSAGSWCLRFWKIQAFRYPRGQTGASQAWWRLKVWIKSTCNHQVTSRICSAGPGKPSEAPPDQQVDERGWSIAAAHPSVFTVRPRFHGDGRSVGSLLWSSLRLGDGAACVFTLMSVTWRPRRRGQIFAALKTEKQKIKHKYDLIFSTKNKNPPGSIKYNTLRRHWCTGEKTGRKDSPHLCWAVKPSCCLLMLLELWV